MWRDYSRTGDLGPVVGKIAGQPIRANQLLRRGYDWENGYGTPSDGQDTDSEGGPIRKLTPAAKSIIIFWSRSGSTKLLASKIAALTQADILEITLKKPYPAAYQKTLARANRERLRNDPPTLDMTLPDLSQYKTVYLGFQTWAMTLSQPMKSFLLAYGGQLNGKLLAPFESEGGYGQGDSLGVIRQLLQQNGSQNKLTSALVVDGNKVDQADAEVKAWVDQVSQQEI